MKAKAKPAAMAEAIVTLDSQEILSFDEVIDRYYGEWILLHIVEECDGWPEKGIVVVRGPTQDSITEPTIAVLREAIGTSRRYHRFRAIPHYRNWDEWRASLDENWQPKRRGGGRRPR
jgi:hypothetical protein